MGFPGWRQILEASSPFWDKVRGGCLVPGEWARWRMGFRHRTHQLVGDIGEMRLLGKVRWGSNKECDLFPRELLDSD